MAADEAAMRESGSGASTTRARPPLYWEDEVTAPYSRVYWSVMDDAKFDGIREDPRLFGSWAMLLIVADMAHPAPAFLPPTLTKAAIERLVRNGLVDLLPGHRYRIHGLEAERGRRSELAAASAHQRWGRTPDAMRTHSGRNANALLDETSKDEQRRDENETSQDERPRARERHDLWSDPEGEALTWLARHHCDIRPGNGYHQKLVVAVERHGVNAVIGMFDRLAAAGTRDGDLKGFLFGAIDALDARTRPDLKALEAKDRAEERDEDFQRRVQRTRERTAELRGVLRGVLSDG